MWVSLMLSPFLAWIPLGYQGEFNSIECKQNVLESSFDSNVHVEATVAYPTFSGTSSFVRHVNQLLENESLCSFNQYMKEIQTPQNEVWEDGNDRIFQHSLYPICCLPNLVSIYGFEYRCRNSPHGSWRPFGRTFWQKDNSVLELTLNDLFLNKSEYQQFIIKYCEDYFKSCKYGYYSYGQSEWPKLQPSDLNTFVLTKNGLLIIFRMYTVNGLNDGPDTVLIPYSLLKPFVNPTGPIPLLLDNVHKG